MRRCRAPTWRSCWRSPTCWPPNPWPTAISSSTYCTGYDRFERYLLGADDGVPKSPQWASAICGLPADALVALARRMAAGRTIVTVSWSLQRVRHGEQAPWMGLTLAAMLGQIGLPGGGFGHGYGSMNEPGLPPLRCRLPALPQGPNPVQTFIPVAAVSDMLLHPGESFDYNGRRLTFPDIKLVYWAGGNPFHHHQNIPGCGAHWAGSTPSWCTKQYVTALLPSTSFIGPVLRVPLTRVRIALLKAWRALPDFDARSRFSSWLFAMTRNECLTALRPKLLKRDDSVDWISFLVDNANPAACSRARKKNAPWRR